MEESLPESPPHSPLESFCTPQSSSMMMRATFPAILSAHWITQLPGNTTYYQWRKRLKFVPLWKYSRRMTSKVVGARDCARYVQVPHVIFSNYYVVL